jgi:hypothetical protein
MKEGGGTNQVGMVLQPVAALSLNGLELVEGREAAVDEGLVGERPQMLGGLEFRAVGGQKPQGQ